MSLPDEVVAPVVGAGGGVVVCAIEAELFIVLEGALELYDGGGVDGAVEAVRF